MKKLLMLTVAALVISHGAAWADNHEGEKPGKEWHKGKMFEDTDTNGDGVISKEEFLTKGEERFTKMDADGDGSLTKEEMEAVHEKMREKMKEHRAKAKEEAAPAESAE